ncbi:MAG TPA: hypothetical protein PLZ79_07830 [Burkholderiales bacterium]|nr:hypothetical protein [Burkholderiaceae bacterium]HQR53166.1 hypothetical protein [Burkholderiales bacterium]
MLPTPVWVTTLLKLLPQRAANQPTAASSPSAESLWANHVSAPSARLQIDGQGNEFVIERDALATELRQRIAEAGAGLGHELHQIMSEWSDLNHGQAGLIADLPYRWRSFGAIAMDLIEQGRGYCRCQSCGRVFAAAELQVARNRSGREYVTHTTQVLCPDAHVLMLSEAHFRVRVPDRPTGAATDAPAATAHALGESQSHRS